MSNGTRRARLSAPGQVYPLTRELLAELVAVPSVNPPGHAYDEVQAIVRRWLADFGLDPQVYEIHGKPNVVVRFGTGAPILLVNGHVDVVPADATNWSHPPFRLFAHQGRLYGRGVADMKAGLAALIVALGTVAQEGSPRQGTIVGTFTVDEESGGDDGLRALLEAGVVQSDWALVAEPTALEVAICGKGVLQQRVRVHGRAAHAAMPSRGINAIGLAAEVIHALLAIKPRTSRPLLGGGTLTVGTIRGGTAPNVVADECEFTIDRRILPGEPIAAVREEIERTLSAGVPSPDIRKTFEIEDVLIAEPFETAATAEVVRRLQTAAERVQGRGAALRGFLAFTDARFLAAAGIPTVVFGPGSLDQAHGADEYVEEAQLYQAVDIYRELFRLM